MKYIQIGTEKIPLDSYVVQGTAFLGIRESGKSVGAKGVAEQLMTYGIPIVVFDAIGVWRHLKRPATAGGRGFPVVVAGGKEADLPLTPASAPEIVRAAIGSNVSLVIDLFDPHLSKADWRRIVRACFRTLFFENVGLRHVFLEETPEYAPQKVIDGETYAEVEKFVRMGGNSSLGITLIGQRSQEINKAILDLCENVVLMRQRGKNAIDALEKFIERVSPDLAEKIAASLPTLRAGECWLFTGDSDTAIRTRTNLTKSFHPDRRRPELTGRAGKPADVSQFVAGMQQTLGALVEQQSANDPARLRSRIAELEGLLRKAGTSGAALPDPAALQRATDEGYEAGKAGMLAAVRRQVGGLLRRAAEDYAKAGDGLTAAGERLRAAIDSLEGEAPATAASPAPRQRPAARATVRAEGEGYRPAPPRAAVTAAKVEGLPSGEAALLRLALQYDRDGGVLKSSLAVLLVGFAERTRQTYQSRLRGRGLIDDSGERITATEAGRRLMPEVPPLPTGAALVEHWRRELPGGEIQLFELLVAAGGAPVTVATMLSKLDFAERTLQTYISRLSKRGVIAGKRGEYRLAQTFSER